MSSLNARRLRRALLCVAALSTGLLAGGSLTAPNAHADLSACRSDPVVLLSNGAELDLSAAINDSSADVQQVVFTLHAPVGVSVVAYIEGSLGAKEFWRFYADNPPGSYDTSALVTTYTPGVSVSATTQALGFLTPALVTVSGQSNQPLPVHLSL